MATCISNGFRGLALSLFLVASSPTARAQLSGADTLRWQAQLQGAGSWLLGNVERLLITGNGTLKHVHPQWGFYHHLSYQYGTIRRVQTEDDLISRNFFYFRPKARWYPYQMTWLERNRRRKIDFRYQIGLGGSWVAVRQPSHLLKLSLTASVERSAFQGQAFSISSYDQSNTVDTWRATLRIFGQHRLPQSLQLQYECWVQPSLLAAENYRYHADLKLSLPLGEHLSLSSVIQHTYENVVLVDVQKADLYWTFGLDARF